MRVKIIEGYNDTQLNRFVEKNTELDVSEERAKTLVAAKVGVIIADQSKAPAPKKGRNKKEA